MFNHSKNSLDEFCNAMIDVQRLYFTPNAEPDAQPEQVELHFMFEDESEKTVRLTIKQLNAKALEREVPQLQVYPRKRKNFDNTLREEVFKQYSHMISEPSCPGKGIIFTSPGMQRLPDGKHVGNTSMCGGIAYSEIALCRTRFWVMKIFCPIPNR